MSKLYFWYGAMGAGKSLELLKVAYNYINRGMEVIIFNYKGDTRFGEGQVASRSGLKLPSISFDRNTDFKKIIKGKNIDCVLIDESQFLTKEQVDDLSDIVVYQGIPVMCYGIKTDFQTNLFEGSKRLLEISHSINELKTICWCSAKATINARISKGNVVQKGEIIEIGGDDKYISLCLKHYKENKIHK